MGRNNTSKMMLLVIAFAGNAQASPLVHEGTLNGFVGPARPDPVPTDYKISIGYGDPSNTLTTDTWFSQPDIYDFSSSPSLNDFIEILSDNVLNHVIISLTDRYGSTEDICISLGEKYIFGLSDYELLPFEVSGIRINVFEVNPYKQDNFGYSGSVALRFDLIGVPEPSTAGIVLFGFSTLQIIRKRRIRH